MREACGDETHFGDPQVQKAIALFKKAPKGSTFEDLTKQQGPTEEPLEVERQPLTQELNGEVTDLKQDLRSLPHTLSKLVGKVGWQVDEIGNPVLVSYQSWAYRTPEGRHEVHRYPYRTTWVRVNGEWLQVEREVQWMGARQSSWISSPSPCGNYAHCVPG